MTSTGLPRGGDDGPSRTESSAAMIVIDVSNHGRTEDLYRRRARLVAALTARLGDDVGGIVLYGLRAEVKDALGQAGEEFCDFAYGANLSHALALAHGVCVERNLREIFLVTYSLPSAHHEPTGIVFRWPPAPEALEAARREAVGCTADHIPIHALLIGGYGDSPQAEVSTIAAFLREITGDPPFIAVDEEDPAEVIERFLLA